MRFFMTALAGRGRQTAAYFTHKQSVCEAGSMRVELLFLAAGMPETHGITRLASVVMRWKTWAPGNRVPWWFV